MTGNPQRKSFIAMRFIPSPHRVAAGVPWVMEELMIEQVQHFVHDDPSPEGAIG